MTLTIAITAIANRYAGSGYTGGTVVMGALFGVAAWFMGAATEQALAVAVMAFAGRQFIGHGTVYRLDPRCAGAWFSICFTRAVLIAFPLGAALGPILLTAFACLGANYLSRKAEDRKMIGDMLKLAEPLQGLWYGVLIALCVGGAG